MMMTSNMCKVLHSLYSAFEPRIRKNIGHGDGPKARAPERHRLSQRLADSAVDRPLEWTPGLGFAVANAEESGHAERVVDVTERDVLQLSCQRPAPAMPLFGADHTGIPQTSQRAPQSG